MAYTQAQYDALTAALAQGAKFVKYADKEIEYRTVAEMEALQRTMAIDLGIIKPSSRKRVGIVRKGLRGYGGW